MSTLNKASLLILILALLAVGQINRGIIEGTITDPQGAVVPEAKVTVLAVATGITRQVATNSAG